MSFLLNPYTSFGGGGGPAFPSIGSTWAWYEPARETGYSNGNGISPLTDQSGNGRHFSYSGVTASRPQYETNVLNSLAVANGDHVSNLGWDTGPNMSGLTAGHVFAVMRAKADPAAAIGDTGLWNFGTDALAAHIPYTDGNVYDDCLSTARKSTGNPTTSMASFVVYEVVSTSSEWTRKINGATSGNDHFTTATNTVAGPAAPTLLYNSGASSRHKLAGLYIFSAKLSAGDRTSVINYINDRFALSSS